MYVEDKFSPYLDDEPIAEFFDDVGQRGMVTGLFALVVHVLIFMILQARLSIPHIPDEPEPIVVEIISFEPEAEPEPEPEPEPELRPAVPPPAQAPVPTPKPKPQPKPTPPPPPPPEPEPEPEPEPVFVPPAPEIIKTPEPEPELEAPPKPEPLPEPTLELFDPELVTQTDPDLAPEPLQEVYEPVKEAVKASEPIAPLFEPDILEPDAEPEDLPEIDELPELAPTPVISEEPQSGVDTPEPELEPEIPPPPAPAPLFQQDIVEPPQAEQLEPELSDTPDIEIAAKPPTIMASPEAPTTQAEAEKAIPQEQAATPLDFILKDRGQPRNPANNPGSKPGGQPRPSGRPVGGNQGAPVFTGATPRANPGAKGWRLKGDWPADGLPGGKGLIRDIDCRSEKRNHEDCPEYIRKNQGRDANGLEAFGPHTPRGTTTTGPTRGMPQKTLAQKVSPTFGDTGLPSTTVLDDVNGFNGQYLGDNVGPRDQGRRVRDIFNPPEPAPWTTQPDLPPDPEDDNDEDELIILKKPE